MDLEEIFNSYYDRVYSFTLLRVGNVHNAENITSDIFLKVAMKPDLYDPEKGAFSTWIFAIALNEIRMFLRKRRVEHSLEAINEIADQFDIEEDLLRREERTALYAAIDRLNGRQRDAILLKYNGGLTCRQIADILKLSETNVETILSRARKNLKKTLMACEESGGGAYKDMREGEAVR